MTLSKTAMKTVEQILIPGASAGLQGKLRYLTAVVLKAECILESPGELVKPQIASPTPYSEFLIGAQEFAFLVSSQVMLNAAGPETTLENPTSS